jgi:hypothetical protein
MNDDKQKRGVVEFRSSGATWAYILIALGALWLLSNFGLLPNLWQLIPLVLIVVGILILTGRLPMTAVETHHFEAPLDGTQSARMKLSLSVGAGTIKALADSDKLIDATLTHRGEVEFAVAGDTTKTVTLHPREGDYWLWLNPGNWLHWERDLRWDIGLTKRIPLDLKLNTGVGESRLDLSGLELTALDVNAGVGSVDLMLPKTDASYTAAIQGGTGAVHVDIADGAAVNLKIRGGIGEFKITTPPDAAVSVKATVGVGDVNLSSRFSRMQGSDHLVGKSGTWETADFASAARQISIDFEGGVGGLRVR